MIESVEHRLQWNILKPIKWLSI